MSNKKAMPNGRQAFTLIEILLIVAIIALLAAMILVSINTARLRAKDNSFKSTTKSIQTALVSCCINSDAVLGSTVGGLMCVGGNSYPNAIAIGAITSENCTGNSFTKTITPGTKNSGNCTEAVITSENVTYAGC